MIDVLRNSVAFSSADQIVTAFQILEKHDKLRLVRYKNKYHVDSLWQGKPPPFRNLMVNVLFIHKGFSVVGELQLTTITSCDWYTVMFDFLLKIQNLICGTLDVCCS